MHIFDRGVRDTYTRIQPLILLTNPKNVSFVDPAIVESVTNRFNNDIRFDPELNIMAYTIR